MSDVKTRLLELIKRRGTISVDEAVESVGLAKTTLREHFLQLERDGLIRRQYERSGPGRPSLLYSLTTKGHRRFPSFEPQLLRELLRFLKQNGDEKTIETFFETFWDRRYEKAAFLMKQADEENETSGLDALCRMLEEEGFMPESRSDPENGGIVVKECNCPFREVVKETTLPCELEAAFYEKLFKTKVNRRTYIAGGDHSCTYHIAADDQTQSH